MNSIPFRLRFGFSLAFLVLLAPCANIPSIEPSHLELGSFLDAKEPRIEISLHSILFVSSHATSKKEFEEFGDQGIGFYRVEVRCPVHSKRFAQPLSKLALRELPDTLIDVRYRFRFYDGDKLLTVFYANKFGNIQLAEGDAVYAASDDKWLQNLWRDITENFVIHPK